ncbi:visual pigment-like receptor peropsin [Mercenaria mercenaria]|uniref:visual pigment-like receptor peropsin n=1 Tax=Mercenaria mercenaria TaxID=6596 RepID=UPI00234EF529|nr:visual pigment-like receptor peropsin [Mercenaria mercenaria]
MDEVLTRIFGSPMIVTSMLASRWLYGDLGCTLYGFFMTWFGVTSTSLFTCISFERYIIMCRPDIKRLLTKNVVNVLGLGCYLHGLVWGFLPLVGVNRYVYEPSGISCTPDWSHDNIGYMLGLFSVCFLMPVLVSIGCYSAIFRELRVRRRERVTLHHDASVERHVAITVAITMFAFLFAWTPYSVIGLNKTLGFEEQFPISKEITLIPLITAKTAGFWNPVIFGFRNKDVNKILAGKIRRIKELLSFQIVCRRTNQVIPEAGSNIKSSITCTDNGSQSNQVSIFQTGSTSGMKPQPREPTTVPLASIEI